MLRSTVKCQFYGIIQLHNHHHPQAAQEHYLWVRASEVIWWEYTRIISVIIIIIIRAVSGRIKRTGFPDGVGLR